MHSALAAFATNVDNAMVDGHWLISNYDQSPDSKFTRFRRLANVATSKNKLPDGIAVESEEAALSRHRDVTPSRSDGLFSGLPVTFDRRAGYQSQ